MQYEQLLQRLFSVNFHGGIKLGLTNCLQLNEALDFPIDKFSAIHVAGTNGKGSVVTKIATALQASGKRVGLYTSPHIACFRERIRINGSMISEEAVQKILSQLFALTEQLNIPATFFEITTLLALVFFAEEKVDVAVIETGLGGRLDATNIVNPLLTIITSISLDHTEILGNSIEEIAMEKAGIIKAGVPIIIGPRATFKCIQDVAELQQSPLVAVEGNYDNFQSENDAIASTALRQLQIPEWAIQEGLKATPPCRVETWLPNRLVSIFPNTPLPKAVILDVAHNPDGISHLIDILHQRYPEAKMRFIVGLSKSKDISACLKLICKVASHIYLVEANGNRAATVDTLNNELKSQGFSEHTLTYNLSIPHAIQDAITIAGQQQNAIVVVCGTFFIMSDVRKALGIIEPLDFLELH